jgi:F0F1-type ATP synthase membrane subunit c/vacuolar-type H+-ATPase subunit K
MPPFSTIKAGFATGAAMTAGGIAAGVAFGAIQSAGRGARSLWQKRNAKPTEE